MLDISGDRGVLKDIIREGAGDPVTPDASVLGTEALGRVSSLGNYGLCNPNWPPNGLV